MKQLEYQHLGIEWMGWAVILLGFLDIMVRAQGPAINYISFIDLTNKKNIKKYCFIYTYIAQNQVILGYMHQVILGYIHKPSIVGSSIEPHMKLTFLLKSKILRAPQYHSIINICYIYIYIYIEQLTEISNVSKDTLRLMLKRREDFWIIKLETLTPKGLN